MIVNWKLGLLAFVICSVTLVPALDSAYGKTVTTTHTPTFTDAFSVSGQEANPEGIAFNADEQFTQLLGIQETELPSWVKNNLAQWVIEDKINLAVMIIAIEHLINLE